MEIIKECGVCGKEFVASKMSVKYCCRGCERVAFRRREAEKKKREKENAESLRNAERNNSLRDKAFLSPEDVSVLFNVSLPTVYRYFQTGLIKAVKIRNKTFVRYSDIERVFDDAYEQGALPLNTLANAVLARHDQMRQMASENYEANERQTIVRPLAQR